MYRSGWTQFFPFIVTIVAIVFTDLLTGIGIGMVVAVFYILKNNYKVGHIVYKEKTLTGGEKYRIVLPEEVTFLNKASIMHTLRVIPKNVEVEIDYSKSAVIDHDVKELIENFKETARSKNIDFRIVETNGNKVSNQKGEPVVL
jgi:SulP family sulfate permease